MLYFQIYADIIRAALCEDESRCYKRNARKCLSLTRHAPGVFPMCPCFSFPTLYARFGSNNFPLPAALIEGFSAAIKGSSSTNIPQHRGIAAITPWKFSRDGNSPRDYLQWESRRTGPPQREKRNLYREPRAREGRREGMDHPRYKTAFLLGSSRQIYRP